MYIPWGKTLFLVSKSMSNGKVKVKYEGQSFFFFLRDRCGGIRVSQTHRVFFFFPFSGICSQNSKPILRTAN